MKILFSFVIISALIYCGCKSDVPVSNNPPAGEVLLAEVTRDSAGTTNGSSTLIRSLGTTSLNFTDRDSARITFYYSGVNNTSSPAFQIYYIQDTNSIQIFNSNSLNISATEQYADITIPSPRVNNFFRYQISVLAFGSSGYFKFRDLKIYKK